MKSLVAPRSRLLPESTHVSLTHTRVREHALSDERRRLTRLNGFKIGTCRQLDGTTVTECLIWNHNEQGALLEFPDTIGPGATFRLNCPELAIDAACRVVWHEGREWGVAYAD